MGRKSRDFNQRESRIIRCGNARHTAESFRRCCCCRRIGRLEEIADDIARELYQLDAELGDACILFAKDSASARALFIAVTPRVLNFWFETLKKLSVAARGKLKLFMEASAFNRSHSH